MSDKLVEIEQLIKHRSAGMNHSDKDLIAALNNFEWLFCEIRRLRGLRNQLMTEICHMRDEVETLTKRCEEARLILTHRSSQGRFEDWLEWKERWLSGKP